MVRNGKEMWREPRSYDRKANSRDKSADSFDYAVTRTNSRVIVATSKILMFARVATKRRLQSTVPVADDCRQNFMVKIGQMDSRLSPCRYSILAA